jgi:parvulin-like peptidyl-prolyl isomerase
LQGVDVNFKRWITLVVAMLALAACGSPAVGTPVARFDNVILSRQELDQRMARAQQASAELAAKQGQPAPPNQDLEQRLVELFIQENLTLGIARQRGIAIDDGEVDTQIEQIRANIQQNPSGLTIEDAIHAQLGMTGVDAPEFRKFISSLVAQRKLAETLVTTDTVRLDLTNQMMAQATQKVDQVHAAHILVETEAEATTVLDRLAKGEAFEALAKELSKDPGSGANGGDLGWLQKGQTVPEFDKAIFEDLKPGEMTKAAVKTQYGFHIIKVLEHEQRASMTEEQAKQAIEQGIPGELQNRRGQALQELLASERKKAKAENRLVEPIFPTPVPEQQPAPEQPPAQEQPQPTPQS